MSINGSLPVPTTAALTPRLGLMAPVDSDLFKSADYADTFSILDAVPGTYPVANLAALQALNWTSAQHGTRVLQLDNGAEWYWYQPSGTGSWKRTNSVGVITYANQVNAISTTTMSWASAPTVLTTPQFTAPGVRSLRVDWKGNCSNTSGLYSMVAIQFLDNGVVLDFEGFRVGSQVGVSGGTMATTELFIINPTAGGTHQISVRIRSVAVSASIGGAGTSTCWSSSLTVSEV